MAEKFPLLMDAMENKSNRLQLLFLLSIWLLTAVFYMHQYFLRVSIGSFAYHLTLHYQISPQALSIIAASFYYAYIILKLPSGLLIDRFGLRIILTVASCVCGIGAILFAIWPDVYGFFISRFLMGAGGTFALIGSISFARQHFHIKAFNTLNALIFMLGTLGAMIGGTPLVILLSHVSIPTIMMVAAAISFVLAAAIFITIREPRSSRTEPPVPRHTILQNLQLVIREKVVWYAGVTIGFLYAPVVAYFSLWLMPHIHAIYHHALRQESEGILLGFFGLLLGGPLFSFISNYTKNIIIPMRVGIIFSFFLMSTIVYGNIADIHVFFIFDFLLGLSMGSAVLIYTYTLIRLPQGIAATAASFINLFQILFGALLLPFVGYLLARHHDKFHHHIINILKYDLTDYHYALLILPLCALAAIIFSFKLPNN